MTAYAHIAVLFAAICAVSSSNSIIKYPKQGSKQPLPEFTVQPQTEYYILKAKVLTLTCRARYANAIQVTCGGEELDDRVVLRLLGRSSSARPRTTVSAASYTKSPDSDDDVLDLETLDLEHEPADVPVVEAQWNVTTADVEEYGGVEEQTDYTCECHAWPEHNRSNILPVRSNQTRILISYLKKIFPHEPIHQTVAANTQVQLQCMPPEGKPTPEISWLKDGRQVNPEVDGNVFISSYGSLMINQARESDTGSYVCVAQNIAGRKQTEPANLTVFVNGRWSDWTPWNPHTCASKCFPGAGVVQTRSRQCIEPKNGGTPCNGSAVDKRPCPSLCPVDGDWGEWSDWSVSCDKNCKQHRQRQCDSPAAERGGQPCEGASRQERQCDGCVVTTAGLSASAPLPVDMQTLLIYLAAACAIAVLFAAATSVYFRRKRRLPTSDSFTLYVENGEEKAASCVSCRRVTHSKDSNSAELKTQTVRLINSNDDVIRSPATINLSATSRSDATPLSAASTQHQQENNRSTIYLTSLTPCQSSAIASTQMPNLLGAVQQPALCQPFTMETHLGNANNADLQMHGSYPPRNLYQSVTLQNSASALNSAALSLPPPPPAQHLLVDQTGSRIAQVAPLRCPCPAPLTAANLANYREQILMNSYALPQCEATAHDRISCSDDCVSAQCGSTCVCENDYALYPDSPEHQYASFTEVSKNVSNRYGTEQQLVNPCVGLFRPMAFGTHRNVSLPLANDSASSSKSAKAQISVGVPDGALLPTCATIGVASVLEEHDRPRLRSDRQTLLSAVTQLRCTSGHRAVTLVKTVVLSLPHCAVLSDDWHFCLQFTHDQLGDTQTGTNWHSVPVDRKTGCAQINESGAVIYCHLDANRCYIMTNRLGRYALVGEPADRAIATKLLRVAAFSNVLSNVAYEHSVRVYVLDDTYDALQNALESERALGGCLLDSPKQLPFSNSGRNLRVFVDTLSLGWRNKARSNNSFCQQEIPFSHVWTGSQTRLHCSFTFERCSSNSNSNSNSSAKADDISNKFICKLALLQADESQQQQTVLNIIQESSAHVELPRNASETNESRTPLLYGTADATFSDTLRQKLSTLLDDDCCVFNWEQFAAQLGVGSCIVKQLATLKDTYSPAETLLGLFEAKRACSHSKDESLQELISVFRRMKRPDCAVLLENELSNKF